VSRARGFTLIEVLVALVVIAVALGALIEASAAQARQYADTREQLYAGWVADNALTDLELSDPFPDIGRQIAQTTLADRDWRIVIDVSVTVDDRLRRADIRVEREDQPGYAWARLSGFLVAP
jgi:general secretion pathway protein I